MENKIEKKLLIGNEAITQGAYEAGVKVAADPFMTLMYTGVNGGIVIVSADDPFMQSSQNEQDNRFYTKFAGNPGMGKTLMGTETIARSEGKAKRVWDKRVEAN